MDNLQTFRDRHRTPNPIEQLRYTIINRVRNRPALILEQIEIVQRLLGSRANGLAGIAIDLIIALLQVFGIALARNRLKQPNLAPQLLLNLCLDFRSLNGRRLVELLKAEQSTLRNAIRLASPNRIGQFCDRLQSHRPVGFLNQFQQLPLAIAIESGARHTRTIPARLLSHFLAPDNEPVEPVFP